MYTIYKGKLPNGHWKIGCDMNYPNRPVSQNMSEYFILEQHSDIMIASEREIELQKEHNVRVDGTPYYMTKINAAKASKAAKENGNHNWQKGNRVKRTLSPKHQFAFSSAGGKANKGKPEPHAIELAKSLNKEWTCEVCGKSGKGRGNYVRYHKNCETKLHD